MVQEQKVDTQLASIAERACREAGGAISPGLLSEYLSALLAATRADRRLGTVELERCQAIGSEAASGGVALPVLVDAYLSAARLVWVHLADLLSSSTRRTWSDRALFGAGEAVLRAADDALAAAARGFATGRRSMIRAEEAMRREFVDDVLGGQADVERLVARAERFGLRLTAPHLVAVARGDATFADADLRVRQIEDSLRSRLADREVLVATKDGSLVCVLSAGTKPQDHGEEAAAFAELTAQSPWRVVIGRPHSGPGGIAASYREARDALEVAARLQWPETVIEASRLAVYQVLLRDREAITELVCTVLGPLQSARGGAGLLETVATFLASGGRATTTARRMHLSVRAVTYRLNRARVLIGYDPRDPKDWLSLQVAIAGSRALDLPAPGTEPA